MIASRSSLLAIAALAGLVVLSPMRAHAQWWRSAPADFESCADTAEKAKTKEDKTAALAECNAKFAGRRKPGGGYTYYDFMQDRTFDIAGPNPTPEEQKHIDQQYTAYLENQRRNTIAAAFTAKQHAAAGDAARRAAGVAAIGDREEYRCRWQARSSGPSASRPPTAPRTHSPANGRGFRKASTI